jgi:uncharacterized protein with beta-barrel porin domain
MASNASDLPASASRAAASGAPSAAIATLGAAFALFVFQPEAARADDCTPNSPVSGDIVTCQNNNGVDVDNFTANPDVHFLTVNVLSDATIDGAGTTFVINDDNTFNNAGAIVAGGDGILAGDRNTIDNTGTINGSDDAIEVGSDSTIINSGILIGGDNAIEITGGGTSTIDNSTTITGTNHAILGGAGVDNVINRTGATINGDIDLAGGDDSLTLEANSVLNSTVVDGGQGSDTITLEDAGTFTGRFTNFESLTKQGADIWTLSGGPSDAVSTAIDAGTLAVDGTLTTTMTVGAAGTLSGVGSVDGNVFNDGGTVAPGNSIGTLTVNGDYTENSPSTLSIEIDELGNHDRLHVLGSATLDPASTLDVVPLAGDYTLGGDVFDVLVADSGLFGTFGTTTASGETKLYLEYLSDGVQLTSFPTIFGSLGETPNQTAVGEYLDDNIPYGICESDLCFVAAQMGLSGDIPGSLEQVHSGLYDAYTTVGFTQARMFGEVLSNRMDGRRRNAWVKENRGAALLQPTPRLATDGATEELPSVSARRDLVRELQPKAWARGIGSVAGVDGNSNHAGYDHQSYGAAGGFDVQLGRRVVLGLAVGGGSTNVDWDDADADGQADMIQTGIYGSYFSDRYHIDGAVAYGHDWFDTKRTIAIGAVNRTAKSSHRGHQIMSFLEAGYAFPLGWGVQLEPVSRLEYVHLIQPGFSEAGAGDVSLYLDDRDEDSLRARSFFKVSRPFQLGDAVAVVPEARVGAAYEFLDTDRNLTGRFAGLTSRFTAEGDNPAQNSVLAGFSLTALIGERFTVVGNWSGDFRSDRIANSMTLGGTFAF